MKMKMKSRTEVMRKGETDRKRKRAKGGKV